MGRISTPLLALMLALLAIPLSFVNPRAGRTNNLILAVLVYLIYSNAVSVCQSWIGQGRMRFDVGLLAPCGDAGCPGDPVLPADQRLCALAETLMIPVYVRYLSREIYAAVLLVLLAFWGCSRSSTSSMSSTRSARTATCSITPRFTWR
jgi:lipopolysaccharide export LptBFGC system permease protein LptF